MVIEARHALEVSPKSLFGRFPYPHEQTLIRDFTKEVDESVMFVSPETVAIPIPLQRLPPDFKRRKIKEHLEKAKAILDSMGIS
jgi:hypothetical protein